MARPSPMPSRAPRAQARAKASAVSRAQPNVPSRIVSSTYSLVAPCSACYKNAYFTNKYIKEDPELADHINYALEEDDLHFNGTIEVEHLMDVFVDDIGVEEIKEKVVESRRLWW